MRPRPRRLRAASRPRNPRPSRLPASSTGSWCGAAAPTSRAREADAPAHADARGGPGLPSRPSPGRGEMIRALRVRMLVAVALLAAGLACLVVLGDVARRLELSTVDARFGLRGERSPGDLVVVGADDVTFDAFDERWPFSRNRHAAVLENVAADRPKVIAYDVQFTEQSDDARADNRLIEASRSAGNVVFGTTEVSRRGRSNVFGGPEGLAFARARAGNGLLPEDTGGVLRRLPERVGGLDTLAVAAVRRMGRPVPT